MILADTSIAFRRLHYISLFLGKLERVRRFERPTPTLASNKLNYSRFARAFSEVYWSAVECLFCRAWRCQRTLNRAAISWTVQEYDQMAKR
ncbi:hypothetical protein EMEDMD4_370161 [Sinorhizobium medicae]|uniref:Uncharacterized protein n=1 Tax=Sinorhizobium medicae TaxID=110321 RepID=A0A508WXW9_9HYPH|nr:hypothetical protein EMEDMD4_370161 [Sinorhizobium medicae]